MAPTEYTGRACPHCGAGHYAELVINVRTFGGMKPDEYLVACRRCGATGPPDPDKTGAVWNWDRRSRIGSQYFTIRDRAK